MDILKLQGRFMRGMVAKLITKALTKKMGYDVSIQIHQLEIRNEDGKTYIRADLSGEAETYNVAKTLKSIGLD